MQELKQSGVATVKSFSVNKSTVVLKVVLSYEELLTSINMLKACNVDVTIYAKEPLGKGMQLGVFTINDIRFDKDQNCVVTFKSLIDSVNPDNICRIIQSGEVKIKFMAVIEQNEREE